MPKEKMVRIFGFLLVGIIFPVFSFAQFNDNGQTIIPPPVKDDFYKYSIQAGTEITYATSNHALVLDFPNGVYAANVAVNASITKRLYVGAEFYDDQFAVSVTRYSAINPRLFLYMGGLRVGYRSATGNDFLFNASVTAGPAYINFTDVTLVTPPKGGFSQKSQFGQLMITENYRCVEQLWIGLDISFTYMPYQYNPGYIGMNTLYPFVPSDYQGPTTFIGWGFQLFYVFSKK
ncbi:MAG TPA: hypothetical protein VK890_11630 [Bacteroidia bacterium]|jgi:hypothetical protein|nr:hypothetical protein [Bacteroidia bacterium]